MRSKYTKFKEGVASTRAELHLRWQEQKAFLGNRVNGIYSGLVLGVGNAVYSIVLYLRGDESALSWGIDAVFGAATQSFFMATIFLLIAVIPLWPALLKVLLNAYDAIIFGLSFIFANLGILYIAAWLIENDAPTAETLVSTLGTFGIIGFGITIFGPFIFDDDIKKFATDKNRKELFGHRYIWWIFYSLWAALIVFGLYLI